MSVSPSPLTDFLKTRRSTIISKLNADSVPEADIETILACGVRVPDHAVLGPWKIMVITGEARAYLGTHILKPEFAKENPEATPEGLAFEENRFLRAGAIFAILSVPKEHPKIPLWEMQLSAGAVAMNVTTAAQALGYGAQWVTEWYSYNKAMLAALGGREGIDQIAGFVYVGTKTEEPKERRRPENENVIGFYTPPVA
ncbi:MAG: nitroreductase family protein [Candidatus Puniceispirillaceae bacterium]